MSLESSPQARKIEAIWQAAWAVEYQAAQQVQYPDGGEGWLQDGWAVLVKTEVPRAAGSTVMRQVLEYLPDERGQHWPSLSTIMNPGELAAPIQLKVSSGNMVNRTNLKTGQDIKSPKLSAAHEMLNNLMRLGDMLRSDSVRDVQLERSTAVWHWIENHLY